MECRNKKSDWCVRSLSPLLGGRSSTYDRRILRVVRFGPPARDKYAKLAPNDLERGLLFLSIQTSIEEQFEFLQARWMNDETRPKAPSGNDLIVGQNAAAREGVRRAVIFGDRLQMAEVRLPAQYVIPTGGGYFFVRRAAPCDRADAARKSGRANREASTTRHT